MSENAFDMVRKIRHLPGLQLTATLEPTQITKRLKNATQKMLRSGVLTGGYASKARMLAAQLLSDAGMQASAANTKWGVRIFDVGQLTKDDRAQIVEFINAARMIELLELAEVESRQGSYIHDRYTSLVSQFNQQASGHFGFNIYQPALQVQITELVAARRTPEQVKAHEALAAKLDSTDRIAINF
jgi:hypothetical protein